MAKSGLLYEELTYAIISAFFEVYNTLGFGFLERIYVEALTRELRRRGHKVAREVYVHVFYKGDDLGTQKVDMIVDDKCIVEIKSTYHLHPAATRQVHSYLKSTHLDVGLLLHFRPEPKFYRMEPKQ